MRIVRPLPPAADLSTHILEEAAAHAECADPDNGVHFDALLFGKPYDRSIEPLREERGIMRHPKLSFWASNVFRALGTQCIYAPLPGLRGRISKQIVQQKELASEIELGNGPALYWNPHRAAAGTWLDHRDAGALSTGGCPIVVVTYHSILQETGVLAYAHAGRGCLQDRTQIISGRRIDTHESVVHALLSPLSGQERVSARVWIFWSIKPKDFPHPMDHQEHGEFNQKWLIDLKGRGWEDALPIIDGVHCFDPPTLIKLQCVEMGVPEERICLDHGYIDHKNAWLEPEKPRNLGIIVRRK